MGQSTVQVDRTVRNGACYTQVPDMHSSKCPLFVQNTVEIMKIL